MPQISGSHTARDIMTSKVATLGPDQSVEDAATLMLERNIGGVPIVDAEGRYLGMVTERGLQPKEEGILYLRGPLVMLLGKVVKDDRDFEAAMQEARKARLGDLMDTKAPTATETTKVSEIADVMLREEVRHIPVLRDGKVVGIVSRHDILRLLTGRSG